MELDIIHNFVCYIQTKFRNVQSQYYPWDLDPVKRKTPDWVRLCSGNTELDVLAGALVVRQAPRKEPHHDLYDEDNYFVLINEVPSAIDNSASATLLINGLPFSQVCKFFLLTIQFYLTKKCFKPILVMVKDTKNKYWKSQKYPYGNCSIGVKYSVTVQYYARVNAKCDYTLAVPKFLKNSWKN